MHTRVSLLLLIPLVLCRCSPNATLRQASTSNSGSTTQAGQAGGDATANTPNATPGAVPGVLPPAGNVPVPATATTQNVPVATLDQLTAALANAKTGDNIQMAAGNYRGPLTFSGKTGVTLSGGRDAIIDTPSLTQPSLLVDGCTRCTLTGFSIRGGQKGIKATGTTGSVFDQLEVSGSQMEAVHLETGSSNNTIQSCSIHDSGLGGTTPAGNNRTQADDGEGVYIGTAVSNDPAGDKSNNNRILNNRIYNNTAENIDIKEFTSGGVISGNALDGKLCGDGANGNVEVKGSGYRVTQNTITNRCKEGIRVYSVANVPDSGLNNVVENNSL